MRIAIVVNQFPALSETFVLSHITGLIDRGHEVDIFADAPRAGERVHSDVAAYALQERTSYFPKVPKGRLGRGFLLLRQVWKAMNSAGPLAALTIQNALQNSEGQGMARRLSQLAPFWGKASYDIVHCHFGPNGVRALTPVMSGVASGKLITTFHGYDLSSHIREEGRDVYAPLFQHGDLFLPISEAWRGKLVELGCPPEKIRVQHMGIDTAKFSFRPRKAPVTGPVQFVTTARLVEKKGVEYAIRAVAKLVAGFPDLVYTVIGDGPLMPDLKALVRELGIGDSVDFVGWKTQDEVQKILDQSHVMVAPSVTSADGDQEGIPVALMEAMAMGLPILSTRHSGIPELVEDGVSGYLVGERNAAELSDRMARMLALPELWEPMGRAGRAKVERDFNLNTLNDELVTMYERAIRGVSLRLPKPTPSSRIAPAMGQ